MVNLLPLEEGEKHQRRAADQAVRRRPFRVHGHEPGHGEEDAAVGVLAAAHQRHHRASISTTTTGWSASALTDGTREIMLFVERRQVHPLQRRGSAADGPRRHRRARHQARPRARSSSRSSSSATGYVLTASANGYGKLTPLEDFPQHGRGGQGVIALQTTERNGEMVAALQVNSEHELMLISSTGTLVRTPVGEISIVGPQHAGRAPDPPGRRRAADRRRAHREPRRRRRRAGNAAGGPAGGETATSGPSDTPTS